MNKNVKNVSRFLIFILAFALVIGFAAKNVSAENKYKAVGKLIVDGKAVLTVNSEEDVQNHETALAQVKEQLGVEAGSEAGKGTFRNDLFNNTGVDFLTVKYDGKFYFVEQGQENDQTYTFTVTSLIPEAKTYFVLDRVNQRVTKTNEVKTKLLPNETFFGRKIGDVVYSEDAGLKVAFQDAEQVYLSEKDPEFKKVQYFILDRVNLRDARTDELVGKKLPTDEYQDGIKVGNYVYFGDYRIAYEGFLSEEDPQYENKEYFVISDVNVRNAKTDEVKGKLSAATPDIVNGLKAGNYVYTQDGNRIWFNGYLAEEAPKVMLYKVVKPVNVRVNDDYERVARGAQVGEQFIGTQLGDYVYVAEDLEARGVQPNANYKIWSEGYLEATEVEKTAAGATVKVAVAVRDAETGEVVGKLLPDNILPLGYIVGDYFYYTDIITGELRMVWAEYFLEVEVVEAQ